MAKQLLLNVLVDTLGPYVEGLSIENLKLGVWSGKIELFNLQLKQGVLNNLNLPVTIIHGSLKSLKLKIPWTALESKPVRVTIDGLYLLAAPLDVEHLSPEEILQQGKLDKKMKLKMAEEAVLAAGAESESSQNAAEKTSYIQQLTAKIVDNLEVTLTNVHIRYEDAFTMPTVVAAGITLDRITLSTTDANWREMFVSRVEKDKTISPTIHKLGKMENLALYWNTRAERLDELTPEEWSQEMQALIFRTSATVDSNGESVLPEKPEKEKSSMSMTKLFSSPIRKSIKSSNGPAIVPNNMAAVESSAKTQLMYLLPPPNKLEVRIIHTDNVQSSSVPKIDLAVEITGLRVDLDKLQYQQLMSTIRMFTELEKQKLIALHRPRVRPTENPRLWWKYAYQLVVGKPARIVKKMEVLVLCCRYRKKYIKLVKSARYRIKNNTPPPKIGTTEYTTIKDEETMLAAIEELLPLQTLIIFRQLAAAEICNEEKQVEKSKSTTQQASAYFSSWFSKSSSSSTASKALATPVKDASQSASTSATAASSNSSSSKPSKTVLVNPFALNEEGGGDDDEVLIENIQKQLAVKSALSAHQVMLRMNLRGGIAVGLTSDGYPICRMEVALTSAVEVKTKSFAVSVSLFDFFVEDLCTSRAVLPYIIVSQTQAMAVLERTARTRTVEASSLETQKTPQCTVEFTSTENDSSLSIKAAPVEVIWNENCFEKLLSMFISSSEDASLVLSNPALIARMNQFAADATLPPLMTLNMLIEIDAPKFVIPEDSESMTGGCMILDMGILNLQGRITPSGAINLQIGLSSINVGMPEITTDRYKNAIYDGSLTASRLYLVNPFNINLNLQNEVTNEADMTIDLIVSDVIAQLDTQKITRILRIVNIVTRTINASMESDSQKQQDRISHIAALPTPLHDDSGVPLDSTSVITSNLAPAIPEQKRQPTDCLLRISLTSPLLSAELLVNNTHTVVLSVTSLVTRVVQRPHDIALDFNLTSLSLDDSLRSEMQRSVIGTKLSNSAPVAPSDLRQHLCSVSLTSAFTKLSPFYNETKVGTDIKLQFSRLNLSIDELSILRLCPLLQNLAKGFEEVNAENELYVNSKLLVQQAAAKRKAIHRQSSSRRAARLSKQQQDSQSSTGVSSPSSTTSTSTSSSQRPVITRSPNIRIPANNKKVIRSVAPTGMRVSCELASVSLMLMRTPEALSTYSVLEKIIDLHLAYSAEISGLSANVSMMDATGTNLSLQLQSFSVTDRRPSSMKYVYKKLLCKSTFASEYSSSSSTSQNAGNSLPEDDNTSAEFGALSSIGSVQATRKSIFSDQPLALSTLVATPESESCILKVKYEEFKGESNVEITLTEVTSFLTLDSIMDLADVAMKNVDAVVKLTEAFNPATSLTEPNVANNNLLSSSQSLDFDGSVSPAAGGSNWIGSNRNNNNNNGPPATGSSGTQLTVNVSVNNPRLLILENAALADGRAIVFRSEIFVSYSTETGDVALKDVKERLNVALQAAEVFILTEGVTKGAPQQVVEPTSISILLNRRLEGSVLLYCKAALTAQDIIARLSLNDIQLANKMLQKAKAKQAKMEAANASRAAASNPNANNAALTKKSRQMPKETSSVSMTQSISMFELNIEMGNINFLAINDANDLYQPVLRFAIDNCCMDARGAPKGGELSGDGAVIFSIDYFNNSLSCWEPVLERCRPCWTVQYSCLSGLSVEFIHDRTFQVNVSGSMTRQVSLLLGLLQRLGQDEDTHTTNQHAVVFYNHLGVPLEIADNASGVPLMELLDSAPIPLTQINIQKKNNRSCSALDNNIPTCFNLRVLGDMEHERKPILGLPLNIHRALPHYLRPELGTASSGGVSPMRIPSMVDIASTEPIVEEIYENQRYFPFQGKWKPTGGGMLGDPNNFSDIQGQGNRTPSEISLPGDRWEWVQADWTVDKHAVIGKEIDADGWEYATNFGAFNASKQRRTQQPFDIVRRRKLVRTRMLKASPKDALSRPLVVFWAVDIDNNGFKHVHIKSSIEITNLLACTLLIMLYGFQGGRPDQTPPSEYLTNDSPDDAIILEPVLEGQKVCIPLLYTHASFMRFRLLVERDVGVTWSTEYDCRTMTGGRGKSGHSELIKDVECASESQESPANSHFQGVFKFSDKALAVFCVPYAIIYNHLPCDVLFRCVAANKASSEFGVVHPGHKQKLLYFDGKSILKVALQVGSYLWSSQIVIPTSSKATQTVDILSPSEEMGGMSVTVVSDLTKQTGWAVLEMHIFVTFMLVDRSSLNVSVRTKRGLPAPVNASSRVNSTGNADGDGLVTASKVVERRSYGSAALTDFKASWIEGSNTVVLFQADDNTVHFGLNKGSCWSESLSLVSIGSSRVQFEVIDVHRSLAYQLAYSLQPLPGCFQATQVVTVMPCFTIVNTLSENLHIRQSDPSPDLDDFTIAPNQTAAWHRPLSSTSTSLQLSIDISGWSFGSIDINEIGSYVLMLPLKSDEQHADQKDLFVVHIDVRFADPADFSYLTVVVWRAVKDKYGFYNTAAICIQNDTDLPLTFLQDSIDFKIAGMNPKLFEICVPPGENLPLGWVDPSAGSRVRAVVDTSLVESIGQQIVMDLVKVGFECNLDMIHYSVELDSVQLIVKAGAGGRILHVIRKSIWENEERNMMVSTSQEFPEQDNVFVKLSFHSLAISLIAEKPIRRELFNIFVDNIDVQWSATASISTSKSIEDVSNHTTNGNLSTLSSGDVGTGFVNQSSGMQHSSRSLRGFTTSTAIYIMDVQIDNYSETAIFPVLMHSYHSTERKDAAKRKSLELASARWRKRMNSSTRSDSEVSEDPLNFITLGAVTFVPQGSLTATYKYIAIRILEIKIAVDTSTLQLYFLDLHNDLIGESVDQGLARANPGKWIQKFNTRTIIPEYSIELVNIPKAQKASLVKRLYIEEFVLHPIKIRMSYQHSTFPRDSSEDIFSSPQYRWLKFIRGIAAVDDFQVRLKSFIVNDALESTSTIVDRIVRIYVHELKKQIIAIASQFVGSLRVIGKPVGLYRNIGAGVKDLFYEPYQGMMYSPESFIFGVGRGTGSLIKNISAGVISSTAAIVESATKGVAKGANFLSGDTEFAKQREEKRRQQGVNSGGLLAGVKAGGESVFSGIASGVTGLVTKPFEEGRKSGVTGFAKGLGLGAIGVIVKPVMGVTDGMAMVAHGISNQISDVPVIDRIRPQRALHRSTIDATDLVLVPQNLLEAQIQAYITKMVLKDGKKDSFFGSVVVQEPIPAGETSKKPIPGQVVFLTDRYVCNAMFDANNNITGLEWKLQYGDISHCVLQLEFISVEIVIYKSSTGGGSGGGVLSQTTKPICAMGSSTITINCCDQEAAVSLYSLLFRMADSMGSPSQMLPVETIVDSPETTSAGYHSTPVKQSQALAVATTPGAEINATELDGYTFGSANILKFASITCTEQEVIARCEARLAQPTTRVAVGEPNFNPAAYLRELDQKVWRFIYEWECIHPFLQSCRCLAGLIINRSEHHVQILRTELIEGKQIKIIGGTVEHGGYDIESRTILSGGGCAVIFAFGYRPTILDPGHAKVKIFTSSFSGQLSTRKAGTSCNAVGGYEVRFLEKSSTDWWSKFVILIT